MNTLDKIVSEFQIFYQKVKELSRQEQGSQQPKENDIWFQLATHFYDNRAIFVSIFDHLKKEENRPDVTLDYHMKHQQLQERIEQEADPVVKISLITTALHHLVYDFLSTKGNYSFDLAGQNEMIILKKPLTYYINISVKVERNVYFYAFILTYSLESLFNHHFYIGVDFEYTYKKIQMAQLNFEHKEDLRNMVMVVNPNELESIMMEHFIKLIICNKFIKKILHGSDSLDIPYMYEHMLNNDPKKIISFTKTLIDTRFLCEYYKLSQKGEADGRCSIYDEDPNGSAIFYFGVISEEQQNRLTEIIQSLPPIHDIVWNIHKLHHSQELYAIYDVIFLKWFYYRIIYLATLEEKEDLGKKAIIEFYKHVLSELTQLVYLENRRITFLKDRCKTEVDPINNYMVRNPGNIYKLIDIFNKVSTNLHTTAPKADIDKLLKINHYKSLITTINKRIVYGILSRKCRIYKDKNTIWTDRLDNQFIFDFLEEMKFYYLQRIFKELEGVLEARVVTHFCSFR